MSNFQLINLNYDVQKNINNKIPNEILKFADLIYDKYEIYKIINNNNKTILQQYFYLNRLLIINLFNGYKLNICIRYGRGYYFYKKNHSLYNYKPIIKVIDLYLSKNLILNNIGYYNKTNHKNNLLSRMFPSELLIEE